MKSPLIIGISGKAEHGKSAASRIMVEAADGLDTRIFEISEPIRLRGVELGLLPANQPRAAFNNAQIKVLVDVGNAERAKDPDCWTKCLLAAIEESGCEVAICPNVRFPQEAEKIKQRSGYVVRINRLNPNGSHFVSLSRDPNDITETALDLWNADYYITNITGHGKLLEGLVTATFQYIWWRHTGSKEDVPFWGR